MAMFAWGAVVYVDFRHSPGDTLDIYLIGKQWMWKVQQPNGLKEINEVHLPVDRDVRLIMASEDVIQDFFGPAFRVKMDGEAGHYRCYCAQYCGTNHAIMAGWITVMEQGDYAAWLSGAAGAEANPLIAGEKLFAEKACITCHLSDGKGRAPSLNGLYGRQVLLADGRTVLADDAYVRESILQPNAKLVAG